MADPVYPADPADPFAAPEAARGAGSAERALRAALAGVRAGVRIAAVPMALTGLGALGLGLAAWRLEQPAVELVAAVGVVAMAAPIWVAVRLAAITRALDDPRALAGQAGDLFDQVRTSPDVGRIVGGVARSHRSSRGGGRPKRFGLLGGLRTLRGAIDAVQPDAQRHDRLVRLRPEQLRRVWLVAMVALWSWLAAAVVMAAALIALAARAL